MCSHTTVQRRKHGCSTAAEQQLQQRCPYAVNAIAVLLLRAKRSASASHPPTPFSRMRLVCDSSVMTPAMAGKPLTGCFTVTCLPLRATASDEWLFPKTNAENEVGGGAHSVPDDAGIAGKKRADHLPNGDPGEPRLRELSWGLPRGVLDMKRDISSFFARNCNRSSLVQLTIKKQARYTVKEREGGVGRGGLVTCKLRKRSDSAHDRALSAISRFFCTIDASF